MKPKLSSLIQRLGKVMPKSQAVAESKYIQRELPINKWIQAANRREKLEPLQYILGNQPFGKLDLICKPGVLIPRIDTESWVIQLSEALKGSNNITLIDYCMGSGCVGLGLLSELSQIQSLIGLDISEDAVQLSKDNYKRNIELFETPKVEIDFHISDLLKGEFQQPTHLSDINLLVSNPPYIPLDHMNEAHGVEKSVLAYEPHLALVGDLEFYDSLCKVIIQNDYINGFVFELGYMHQAEKVMERISSSGGWKVGVKHDDMERIRCVVGWKTPLLECLHNFKDSSLDI